MIEGLGRRFKRYLVTGFLIITPIGITVLLLGWLVRTVDALAAPLTATLLGRYVPGLGLIAAVVVFLGAGFLGSNIAGRHLLEVLEDFFLHIPVFNWLYRTVKQLTEVFSPDKTAAFEGVALIEYPRPGVQSLGFVTRKFSLEKDGRSEEMLCVYVPTNHIYIGDVVLVPKAKARMLGLTLQDAVQSFLSAGASLPDRLEATEDGWDQKRRSGT